MKRNPQSFEELARLHALEATIWPPRITKALNQLALAADPRRNGGEGPGQRNGIGDPTGVAATEPDRTAVKAVESRRRLQRAVLDLYRLSTIVNSVLDEWAPQSLPGLMADHTIWCVNHLKYGRQEPRAENGQRDCRWCADVHREYGRKPTGDLIRAHHEGRRISEGEYRGMLGVGVSD